MLKFLPLKTAEAQAEYYNFLEGEFWEKNSWLQVEHLTASEILEKYKDRLTPEQIKILRNYDTRLY